MTHLLKLSKYRVFSGPYFPEFRLNTGKYGPEKTPYLNNFHEVAATTGTAKKIGKSQAWHDVFFT